MAGRRQPRAGAAGACRQGGADIACRCNGKPSIVPGHGVGADRAGRAAPCDSAARCICSAGRRSVGCCTLASCTRTLASRVLASRTFASRTLVSRGTGRCGPGRCGARRRSPDFSDCGGNASSGRTTGSRQSGAFAAALDHGSGAGRLPKRSRAPAAASSRRHREADAERGPAHPARPRRPATSSRADARGTAARGAGADPRACVRRARSRCAQGADGRHARHRRELDRARARAARGPLNARLAARCR